VNGRSVGAEVTATRGNGDVSATRKLGFRAVQHVAMLKSVCGVGNEGLTVVGKDEVQHVCKREMALEASSCLHDGRPLRAKCPMAELHDGRQ